MNEPTKPEKLEFNLKYYSVPITLTRAELDTAVEDWIAKTEARLNERNEEYWKGIDRIMWGSQR